MSEADWRLWLDPETIARRSVEHLFAPTDPGAIGMAKKKAKTKAKKKARRAPVKRAAKQAEIVPVTMTTAEKSRFMKAACAEGMPLMVWILDSLKLAANASKRR